MSSSSGSPVQACADSPVPLAAQMHYAQGLPRQDWSMPSLPLRDLNIACAGHFAGTLDGPLPGRHHIKHQYLYVNDMQGTARMNTMYSMSLTDDKAQSWYGGYQVQPSLEAGTIKVKSRRTVEHIKGKFSLAQAMMHSQVCTTEVLQWTTLQVALLGRQLTAHSSMASCAEPSHLMQCADRA